MAREDGETVMLLTDMRCHKKRQQSETWEVCGGEGREEETARPATIWDQIDSLTCWWSWSPLTPHVYSTDSLEGGGFLQPALISGLFPTLMRPACMWQPGGCTVCREGDTFSRREHAVQQLVTANLRPGLYSTVFCEFYNRATKGFQVVPRKTCLDFRWLF